MRVTGIPQATDWAAMEDPQARLGRGLSELYAYYRANERMLATILGDATAAEALAEPDLFDRHMAHLLATLTDGWRCSDDSRPILDAVIAHAMGFETWRSLTRAGLSDDQARDLLVKLAVGVAEGTLTATSAN